jgi:Calcineurin-like phosphoesterase
VSKASRLGLVIVAFLLASGMAAAQSAAKDKPKPDSGVSSARKRAKSAQPAVPAAWNFAVSGDSRNCGDVIMPAIAASVKKNNAAFYWHLGDLRATSFIDEDYLHEPEHRQPPPDKSFYDKTEWDDFIQNQLNFFGSTPVFVGIGNHETYPPKSREQFIIQFADWLDSPALRQQRLADNPNDHALKSFFHWIQNGVDFIYLDNSTKDQFDSFQLGWFEGVLKRATADQNVKTIVVGMHAALPDSLAAGHSMSDTDAGTQSGRQVYTDLLNFRQQTRKHVYVLSSHSHFYMSGIFDSDYWRANGGVLPGWIVGTAGAMRYALPATAARAKEARQKIYGYLLGTGRPDGSIDFVFHEIKREDVLDAVTQRYTPEFVDACFTQN